MVMADLDEAYGLLLYKFLNENQAEWSDHLVRVTVVADQEHINLAKTLFEKYMGYGPSLKQNGKFIAVDQLTTGDPVTFELAPVQKRDFFHAQNLDQLLARKSGLLNKPEKIIVQDLGYVSFETEKEPEAISAFLRLNTLLKRLITLNVLEARSDEDLYLFFASGTLQINAKANGETVKQNAGGIIDASDDILGIFKEENHQDDKVRLLKAVLYDSWRNVTAGERMAHFLRHGKEIAKNFSNNYELFVSGFSFDSETEKLIREQHAFSARLSDILTSIQGRILAIPLSLILAFGQMKTAPEDNPLLINTGILLAACVFAYLMWYLLNSQEQVLHGLKEEIDDKIIRFKLKIPSLYLEVEDKFARLEKQYRSTRNMLILLKVLIVLGLIITVFAWAYLTPQVWSIMG